MEAKRGLGKGLGALIPKVEQKEKVREVLNIDINTIEPNPYQPRRKFEEKKVEEIMVSIREEGLLQPILVSRLENGKFMLVVGERRLRALKKLGWKKVPAIVIDVKEEKELLEKSLIENVQRENLTPIEEALAYKRLWEEFGYKLDEIARIIGKDKSTISNMIRLLSLPEEIISAINEGKITVGHGRAILMVGEREKQIELFHKILNEKLNVRKTEKIASPKSGVKNISDPNILSLIEEIQRKMGTRVKLFQHKKKGTLIIEFTDENDLMRILNYLVK